jgi:phasin family protein
MTNISFDKIVSFSKDNADALVKSSTAAVKGIEDLAKASQSLAAKSVEQFDASVKAVFAVKAPTELAALQQKLTRESFEHALVEGRKFAELVSSVVTSAIKPLHDRLSAFQSSHKDAA